ncbi:hypothetical protein [Methanocella arvoryzae]|uniref:CHAT domain-containing protein n=1 Tax=Methanocella arvoryzae (strain DSM 22066 / NBRC 105507 / MRE50) TaxID=351160 RepID=Q0W798_METAR|nr:hypothetical protein [Methanocella arvoryzae]CAH04793.1 hypothetical protein orf28 [uncultured archaeon]CAJ35745.1 hypothetical protein RCIX278 [Methanocella arvoryzae MRE50]
MTPLRFGRHHIRGGQEIIVAECTDRIFIEPEDDCIVDMESTAIRVEPAGKSWAGITWGILSHVSASIPCAPSTGDLFSCISTLCRATGDESVMRSHPFFRRPLRAYPEKGAAPAAAQRCCSSDVTFYLPHDLQYLYAAAPLACYAGADIKTGRSPAISLSGELLPLSGDPYQFARQACGMLRFAFHADCAARYEFTTGRPLAGIDVTAETCLQPKDLLSMSLADRLLAYFRDGIREDHLQSPWHTATYLDPVPSSIAYIPSLLQSLTAIFSPAGRWVTEREVVLLEVRQFLGRCQRTEETGTGRRGHVIMPVLENAFVHQWISDGYPIDAIKQIRTPMLSQSASFRIGQVPRIAIICNEDTMIRETVAMRDTLEDLASIALMRNVTCDDIPCILEEGYDIVQFIGHCDHRGFKCQDGYADLSIVEYNRTPVFFFNSCSSYLQGMKLLEKGSICGISTLYKVTDEVAMDISLNFYRLLARGYPVLVAYLGAKECSVIGKEYLLMGDGQVSLFNAGMHMPLYKLVRSGSRFDLSCLVSSFEKGLVHCAESGSQGLPDTGILLRDISLKSLIEDTHLPEGSCISDGRIFDSIADAVYEYIEYQSIPAIRNYNYIL